MYLLNTDCALDPYSKAKYDTIFKVYKEIPSKLDPYSKAKYDTIKAINYLDSN